MHSAPTQPLPTPVETPAAPTRHVALALALYLVTAIVVAASGFYTLARAPLVPLTIITLTSVLALSSRAGQPLRRFIDALDLRALVAFHATRALVGARFIALGAARQLAPEFASRAGYGDLAVGLGAIALLALLTVRRDDRRALRVALAWNALGLLDLLVALFTVQSLMFLQHRTHELASMLVFPGPLVPLVLVPVCLVTHGHLHRRLRAALDTTPTTPAR